MHLRRKADSIKCVCEDRENRKQYNMSCPRQSSNQLQHNTENTFQAVEPCSSKLLSPYNRGAAS